jgi:hypothetical protein
MNWKGAYKKKCSFMKKRVFKCNYCLRILCYTSYMTTTSCKKLCVKFHSCNSFFSLMSKCKSNPSLWRAGFTIALHCQGQTCPSSLKIGLGFCQMWSLSTSWTQKWSPGRYLGTWLGELQHHIVAQVAVLIFDKAWTIHMTRHSHTLLLQTN